MENTAILSTLIFVVIIVIYLVVSSFIQYKIAKKGNIYVGFIIPLLASIFVGMIISDYLLFWILTIFGFSYYLLIFFLVRNTKSLELNESTKIDLKDL